MSVIQRHAGIVPSKKIQEANSGENSWFEMGQDNLAELAFVSFAPFVPFCVSKKSLWRLKHPLRLVIVQSAKSRLAAASGDAPCGVPVGRRGTSEASGVYERWFTVS
jgi:hypothetical protein